MTDYSRPADGSKLHEDPLGSEIHAKREEIRKLYLDLDALQLKQWQERSGKVIEPTAKICRHWESFLVEGSGLMWCQECGSICRYDGENPQLRWLDCPASFEKDAPGSWKFPGPGGWTKPIGINRRQREWMDGNPAPSA